VQHGVTPTIGANGNWVIGTTDTGVPARGVTGATGATGATPTIGPNGNWFINGVDTGLPSRGAAASGGFFAPFSVGINYHNDESGNAGSTFAMTIPADSTVRGFTASVSLMGGGTGVPANGTTTVKADLMIQKAGTNSMVPTGISIPLDITGGGSTSTVSGTLQNLSYPLKQGDKLQVNYTFTNSAGEKYLIYYFPSATAILSTP
jgi:hypothetical protein